MPVAVDISPICQSCGKALHGRQDKKFCDTGCKNEYNNRLQRKERTEINHIDLILKHNRRILRNWLGAATTRMVSRTELLQRGFRFEYYTHHYTNNHQDSYCFCYDFGYLEIAEGKFLVVRSKG